MMRRIVEKSSTTRKLKLLCTPATPKQSFKAWVLPGISVCIQGMPGRLQSQSPPSRHGSHNSGARCGRTSRARREVRPGSAQIQAHREQGQTGGNDGEPQADLIYG